MPDCPPCLEAAQQAAEQAGANAAEEQAAERHASLNALGLAFSIPGAFFEGLMSGEPGGLSLPFAGPLGMVQTRFLAGTTVRSFGRVVGRGTVDLAPTLRAIRAGEIEGHAFMNAEGLLPVKSAGYYRSFDIPTSGVAGRGSQRLVMGRGGETYYTPDHYQTFTRVNPWAR